MKFHFKLKCNKFRNRTFYPQKEMSKLYPINAWNTFEHKQKKKVRLNYMLLKIGKQLIKKGGWHRQKRKQF